MENTIVRTKYCPHCGSTKIHKVLEPQGAHFHECDDCQEAWEHHEAIEDEDTVVEKSNN